MEDQMKGQMGGQRPEDKCPMCSWKMGGMSGCGMCGGRCHWGFRVLRWVLGLVIIVIVFSLGVALGEFKGALAGGYGYGMMRMPYANCGYGRAYPMMQGWNYQGYAAPTQPSTPKAGQ